MLEFGALKAAQATADVHRGSIIVAQERQGIEQPGRVGSVSHIFPPLLTTALVPKRNSSARTALFHDTENVPQVLSAD